MDTRSCFATACVCLTVMVSSVLYSHAGTPAAESTAAPAPATPQTQHGTACPCPGDANCDGLVNFQDISEVLTNWLGACCPAGNACDDGNPCTSDDRCTGNGGCAGTPINCDDGNPCTADLCVNGVCQHTPVAAGFPCGPFDPCAETLCDGAGQCVILPLQCDDNDPCTVDECVNGVCQSTPVQCPPGMGCVNGVCQTDIP